MLRSCLVLAVLAAISAGCVNVVPPPATPDQVALSVDNLDPQAEGAGRVVVDVVDGPTQVYRVTRTSVVVGFDVAGFAKDHSIVATSRDTEPLCISPCAIDLPPDRYTLAFPTRNGGGRFEMDYVAFAQSPSIYRRALGSWEGRSAGHPLGIVSVTFGGMSLATGAALFPVGLAIDDGQGLAIAGGITLGVGAILTALGVWGIVSGAATLQPGAGIQYNNPSR